jgi:predicted P-loop ATPase
MSDSKNVLLQSALNLASHGYRVIPLHNITAANECSCQAWLRENGSNRECPTPGKHPRFREFAAKATTDAKQIRQWWAKWPRANVGIIAGKESGIWGLDKDPRNGGNQSRDSLVYKIGQLPYTMTARTGGDGTHEYFRWPADFDIPPAMSLGEDFPGIDIVGEGHVLVAPPSYHFTSGRTYQWEPELNPDEQMPVDAPPALLAMLKARIDAQTASATSGTKPVGNFPLADVGKIMRGCAWMRHCAEDAAQLGEPEWYAQLSILGRCENGDALAHDLSSPHPGYNASATAAKLRHALNDTGPVTCGRVRHSLGGARYCDVCEHAGKLKSPVVLGMRAERQEPTPWPEDMRDDRPPQDAEDSAPTRSAEEGMEPRSAPIPIDIRARVEKVIADDDVTAALLLAGHLASQDIDILAVLKEQLRAHFGKRLKMRDLEAAIKDKRAKQKPGSRSGSFGGSGGGNALAEPWEDRWESRLLRTEKGHPCANLANAMIALRHAPEWKGLLWRDDFAEQTITRVKPPIPASLGKWTNLHDILATNWMQEHGIDVSLQITGLAVEAVAHDQHCHPPREYVQALKWDGTFRIGTWLRTYLGGVASEPVPDCFTLDADGNRVPALGPDGKPRKATPYVDAVGEKWLISAIARIFQPGCKADCALVLEGEQGLKKSSALKVIGGEWFTDELDAFGSKDSKMQTHGKWIIEIGELASISKSEIEDVKSFMSRQEERYRPPYAGRLTEVPRQCIFAGTANNSNYLKDDSGNRRFWPVQCLSIDLEALRRDRDQLLAEACFRYGEGATWWLDVPEVRSQAEGEQAARFLEDPWDERVKRFLRFELETEETTIYQVMEKCLGIEIPRQTRADGNRVASILRVNGWAKVRKGGKQEDREWVYRPKIAAKLARAKQTPLIEQTQQSSLIDDDVPQ